MSLINPATDELIKEIQYDDKWTIREKFKQAELGQKAWEKVPVKERVECIRSFAGLLLENREELAKDLCLEVGKPISEALAEVEGAAAKCGFFVSESESLLEKRLVNKEGNTEEFIGYDPLGVVGNISAWNYPYLVGINVFVPALICANAVMYKPSEHACMTGNNIARLLWQAGVPKDVFQIILGEGDAGSALCDLPLDGYFFTGSNATGVKVATQVAGKLVPVGLELGGKDPLYVTDELESVHQAASAAVEGAFYNNGQSCCSVERIYVHRDVYEDFVRIFVEKVKELRVGDPTDPETQIGALTRKEHIRYLELQLEDALSKGATLRCGGERLGSKGNFFAPTVLTEVNHTMDVMKEETFGPLVGIQRVDSDEQALELMNDTRFGLTSAVFCADRRRGEEILSQVNSGTGYLNCCDRVSAHLPWSGRKSSGLGTTLSQHGLYAFCAPKGFHVRS